MPKKPSQEIIFPGTPTITELSGTPSVKTHLAPMATLLSTFSEPIIFASSLRLPEI